MSSLPWSLLDHQPRAEALCPVQSPVYSSSSGSTLHGTRARVKTPWSLPSLAVAHGNKRVAAGRFGMLLMLRVPVDKSARYTVVSPLGRAGPAPPAGRDAARVLDGLSARRRERGCAHPIFVQEPRARDAERLGSTHQEGELGFREARTGRRYHTRIILDYSVLPDTLISTSLSARSCPQRASSAAAVPVAVEPSLPVRLDLEVVLEL